MKIAATFRKVGGGLVLRLEPREGIEAFTLDFVRQKLHFSAIPSCYQGIDSSVSKEGKGAFAEYDIASEERGRQLVGEIRERIKDLRYEIQLTE